MGRLTQGKIGDRISSLITIGVPIKCGNCGRHVETVWGRILHAVYDDGSGRCWAGDGIAGPDDNGVSTRFGADLIWAEQQATKPVLLTKSTTTITSYEELCEYMDAVGVKGPSLHPRTFANGGVVDSWGSDGVWNGWNMAVAMGMDGNGKYVSIELWCFASGRQDHEANGHLGGEVWERLAYPLELLPALPVINHPKHTPGFDSTEREDNS